MVSTLAQQSAQKAVEELAANPDKIAERFVEFEPEEQQLLLKEMGKRIAKLSEVERIWKSLDIPTADLQEHMRRSTLPNQPSDGDTNEDAKREQIKGSWLWLDYESEDALELFPGREEPFDDHWCDDELFAQGPDALLTLCPCHPTTEYRPTPHEPCACIKDCPPSHQFSARISPQLLLYRLTVLFGLPPQMWGWGTSTWRTALEYTRDESHSRIDFADYQNHYQAHGISIHYAGTTEGSQAGVDLLNEHLRSDFSNTPDFRPAGISADRPGYG